MPPIISPVAAGPVEIRPRVADRAEGQSNPALRPQAGDHSIEDVSL
jgi:hypothetical protein